MIVTSTLSSTAGMGIAALQSFVALTSFKAQSLESTATPYGKFSPSPKEDDGPRISGRTNMMIIYTPALAVNALLLTKAIKKLSIPY